MTDATYGAVVTSREEIKRAMPDLVSLAFRNILRTRRRTWLTASGIAFAIFLLAFMTSLQFGAFLGAVDNSARIILGHFQLQHPDYEDDPAIENSFDGASGLIAGIESHDGVVAASARAQAFALVSSGERSYGAQVIGVEYAKEASWSALTDMQLQGRYIEGPGEAFVGSALARNLGIAVGDEMVILGTAVEGGVAAMAVNLVGTYTSGQPQLDRAIVEVSLQEFRAAWSLGADEANAIVVVADSLAASESLAPLFNSANVRSLGWRDLQPEMVQMMELKLVGGRVMFVLVAIIVIFSVVNSFMMVIFERTPEFGMLIAVGMRPGHIILQLQIEALLISLLGVVLGLVISSLTIGILAQVGIPLPAQVDDLMQTFSMPDRIYPLFAASSLYIAIPIMVLGTQIAALIPGLRLQHMRAVEALRATE